MFHNTLFKSVLFSQVFTTTVFAQTFTADFDTSNGEITTLNQTNITTNDGELSFVAQNAQGAGVSINALEQLGLDSNSNNTLEAETLYFDFSFRVPAENNNGNYDIGFVYGREANNANTSMIDNGGSINGFTLFVQNGSLFGVDFINNSNQPTLLLGGFNTDDIINIQLQWQTVEGQNRNQFNNIAVVTAENTTTGATSSPTTLAGATNQNANNINNYTFTARTQTNTIGTITDFTVSTDPINTVPEPSTSILILPTCLWFIFCRRRD